MKKTALITGANKGIGFEIARQLGAKGWHIVISGREENRLEEAARRLQNFSVEILLMDVSQENNISQAAAIFSQRNSKLDVLINNAAILSKEDKSLMQENSQVYHDTLRTNCYGPLCVIRTLLPLMNRPGRIINLSSGGGSMTDPVGGWAPAYCVSKSLLNSITRQLAFELFSKKIAVNAVCPGWVKTDMGGASAPRSVEKGAETPVWLAEEAAQELTGRFFRDKKEIPW